MAGARESNLGNEGESRSGKGPASGFDWLAPHYGWMESLVAGRKLQGCRTALLAELRPERILTVGEGHGKSLLALMQRFPDAEITCVDASAAMLAAARKRLLRAGVDTARVSWVNASLPEWRPEEGPYDLVVTHFFLDCFEGPLLGEVIRCLAAGCRGDAFWLVGDFQKSGRGWRGWRNRAILWAMYRFFRQAASLPAGRWEDPAPVIRSLGFESRVKVEMEWGLIYAELWRRSR